MRKFGQKSFKLHLKEKFSLFQIAGVKLFSLKLKKKKKKKKKKKDKSAQRKEKKATKTLAIVLGKNIWYTSALILIFFHIYLESSHVFHFFALDYSAKLNTQRMKKI